MQTSKSPSPRKTIISLWCGIPEMPHLNNQDQATLWGQSRLFSAPSSFLSQKMLSYSPTVYTHGRTHRLGESSPYQPPQSYCMALQSLTSEVISFCRVTCSLGSTWDSEHSPGDSYDGGTHQGGGCIPPLLLTSAVWRHEGTLAEAPGARQHGGYLFCRGRLGWMWWGTRASSCSGGRLLHRLDPSCLR